MKFRVIGQTGINVSEVGLGTWQLGGDWKRVDDKTARTILKEAVDQGVNFFDTADVYGRGLSESRIGKFLKGCSEKVFVATKLGRFSDPGWPKNFSLTNFRGHTEASLKRLGTEALDLTQIHCLPTEFLKKGDLFEWLRILKKEGKIKNFGASVESMEEAIYCLKQEGLASLQVIFNIFRQKPISTLLEQAKQKGVALLVRLPLASGLLSGKFRKKTKFSKNDHRYYNRDGRIFNVGETFAGIPFEKGIELVEELKAFIPVGMTMAQMALRWILDFGAVTAVIPGATNSKQVTENVSASYLPPLSKDLHFKLKEFYDKKVAQYIRGKY